MRATIHLTLFCTLLIGATSCNTIFKNYINKKYPPVSSLEKSASSVRGSLHTLDSLPKAGLGVDLRREFLDSLIKVFFVNRLMQDSSLGISNVGQIEFLTPPVFTLGQQEIIVTTGIRLSNIQNKYLKQVDFDLNGRISPSVRNDSLLLAPSFSQVHVQTLRLRKWIILGGLAKQAVNALMASYMDNINGALRTFAVDIRYPPIPERRLSQLLGTDANLQVTRDDTFRMKPRRLTPVILIDTGHLSLLADVTTAPQASLPPDSTPTGPVTAAQFATLFHLYDSLYKHTWTLSLDSIDTATPPQSQVYLAYATLSDIVNELWAQTSFALQYDFTYHADMPMEQIKLAEISMPDCGTIPFNYSPFNCSSVLSDCGSCSWWNVPCHIAWAACQTANGVKWAACQTANAAKLATASAEWVAQKALCYTEVAGIFIVNNLVLSVGFFQGSADIAGAINGTLDQIRPGGIESLGLTANVQANGQASFSMVFIPTGVVGLLACTLPTAASFDHKPLSVNAPALAVNATMEKVTNGQKTILRVHTGDINIPIQLGQPLILDILAQPQLVLSCSVGLYLGTLIGSVMSLANNEHFKNYMNAVFAGGYNWTFNKDLDLDLPAIPITSGAAKFTFQPSWGKKSLIYTKQ